MTSVDLILYQCTGVINPVLLYLFFKGIHTSCIWLFQLVSYKTSDLVLPAVHNRSFCQGLDAAGGINRQ